MAETYLMLKSGDRWVVIDWKMIDTQAGPPLERSVSAEAIIPDATNLGFRLVESFDPGPVTWGLVWEKS